MLSGGSARLSQADLGGVVGQVQRWVEQGIYRGAALIIGRGEQIAVEQYFGEHTPQTVEFIASGGKWLAAAAIAAVVDRGLLGWDDPVARWLPELGVEKGRIRLRQLLSHTSGLAEQQPAGRPNDDYQTLAESVAQLAPLPLKEPPGTRFRYGALALQLAGRMAELATGRAFEALFEELLARPLELEHTRFTPVDPRPGHNPMLSGGARSSARDYARFLGMISRRGRRGSQRVLSAAAIEALESDQVGTAQVAAGELVERVRGATHTGIYGLGQWREHLDAQGRATLLSSPSWAGTYPWIDREQDVYGVLLAHVDLDSPAWRAGFNPLYASPVLAQLVRAALERAAR